MKAAPKLLVEIRKNLCYFLIGVNHEGTGKLSFPQMLFLYNSRFVGVTLLELCFSELAKICPKCNEVSETETSEISCMYALSNPQQRKVKRHWREFGFFSWTLHRATCGPVWSILYHVASPTQWLVFDELASFPRGGIKIRSHFKGLSHGILSYFEHRKNYC